MSKSEVRCYLYAFKHDKALKESVVNYFSNNSPFIIGNKWKNAEEFLTECGGEWTEITGRCPENCDNNFVLSTADDWNINRKYPLIVKKTNVRLKIDYYFVNTACKPISDRTEKGMYYEYTMEKCLALMLYNPLTHFLATDTVIRDREIMVNAGHTTILTVNVDGFYSQNPFMFPWIRSGMEIPNTEFYNSKNFSGNELYGMWKQNADYYCANKYGINWYGNEDAYRLWDSYYKSNWFIGNINTTDWIIRGATDETPIPSDFIIPNNGYAYNWDVSTQTPPPGINYTMENIPYVITYNTKTATPTWRVYVDASLYGFERQWVKFVNVNGCFEYLVSDDVQAFNNPKISGTTSTNGMYILGTTFKKAGQDADTIAWQQSGKLQKIWTGENNIPDASDPDDKILLETGLYTIDNTMWLLPIDSVITNIVDDECFKDVAASEKAIASNVFMLPSGKCKKMVCPIPPFILQIYNNRWYKLLTNQYYDVEYAWTENSGNDLCKVSIPLIELNYKSTIIPLVNKVNVDLTGSGILIPILNDAFKIFDDYIKFNLTMNERLGGKDAIGSITLNEFNPENISRNAKRLYLSMYGDTNENYFSYDKINPELFFERNEEDTEWVVSNDVVVDLVMNINGSTTYMLSFGNFLYKNVSTNNIQLAVTINDDSLDMLDSPYSQYWQSNYDTRRQMLQNGEEKISQEGNQAIMGAPSTAASMASMMPGPEGAAFGGIMGAMQAGTGFMKLATDALGFHPVLDHQINFQMQQMADKARAAMTTNRKTGGVRPFLNFALENMYNKPIVCPFSPNSVFLDLVKKKILYYGWDINKYLPLNYLFAWEDFNYLQADLTALIPNFQDYCEKNNVAVSIDEIQSYVNKVKNGVWFVNNINGDLNIEQNSIKKEKAIPITTPIVSFEEPYDNITVDDNTDDSNKTISVNALMECNTGWGSAGSEIYSFGDIYVLGLPFQMDYELVEDKSNPNKLAYSIRVFMKDAYINQKIEISAVITITVNWKFLVTGESGNTNTCTIKWTWYKLDAENLIWKYTGSFNPKDDREGKFGDFFEKDTGIKIPNRNVRFDSDVVGGGCFINQDDLTKRNPLVCRQLMVSDSTANGGWYEYQLRDNDLLKTGPTYEQCIKTAFSNDAAWMGFPVSWDITIVTPITWPENTEMGGFWYYATSQNNSNKVNNNVIQANGFTQTNYNPGAKNKGQKWKTTGKGQTVTWRDYYDDYDEKWYFGDEVTETWRWWAGPLPPFYHPWWYANSHNSCTYQWDKSRCYINLVHYLQLEYDSSDGSVRKSITKISFVQQH